MTEEKIKKVTALFAEEAKKIFGEKLKQVILYGSCARGDFQTDSDIDILLLLSVPRENLAFERKKIFAIADGVLNFVVCRLHVVHNVLAAGLHHFLQTNADL